VSIPPAMDGKSLQTGKMFQVTDSVHLYRVKPITASEQGTRRTNAPDQGGSYLTLHRPVFAGLGQSVRSGFGGGFGDGKRAGQRHTTCRGRGGQRTTTNSAFSRTSGLKGVRLQRLPSAVGFGSKDANRPGMACSKGSSG
jgi:hypothetical protein